jgi:hypothetical protein
VHPNVSAVVYVAARAPDAGEDYAALAKQFPTPPASAGIVFDGDEGRLSEEAFLRDFAGDLLEARQSYIPQKYRRKLSVSGRDKTYNRCSSLQLRQRGVLVWRSWPPARRCLLGRDTGGEFPALSHWA